MNRLGWPRAARYLHYRIGLGRNSPIIASERSMYSRHVRDLYRAVHVPGGRPGGRSRGRGDLPKSTQPATADCEQHWCWTMCLAKGRLRETASAS